MLLSHRYRFLFVHIAKTGGTSVRAALSRRVWIDPWRIPLFLCSRLSHLSGHRLGCKFPRHAKAIAAKEMLPRDFYDSLFKFCFVRNPWDLQVSSFHHLKRERPHLVGDRSFAEFLRYKLDPERPYQYHLDISMERQSDYVIDLEGNIIVDFIGRYERLEQDYAHVLERIGLSYRPLPRLRMAGDRGDYRRYYTDDTVELVMRHYGMDIERFGYQWGQTQHF
jgi:hypothetical protein